MISYAQNFEDVLLRRLFPESTDGFYVDVGAGHPTADSVTKYFYDRGWNGINVEPNPASHATLAIERPRDLNLNLGASNRLGSLPFYEYAGTPCWSVEPRYFVEMFGADPADLRRMDVPVVPLAEVFREHVRRTIDFLKIDAEGHDLQVLEGADLEHTRPRVVLVEGSDTRSWADLLDRSGYRYATCDGVNSYYIRSEDAALLPRLAAPVNVTDNFVHNSLVALRQALDETQSQLRGVEQRHAATLARLAPYEDLGPRSLAVARRVRSLARRHPKAASLLGALRVFA